MTVGQMSKESQEVYEQFLDVSETSKDAYAQFWKDKLNNPLPVWSKKYYSNHYEEFSPMSIDRYDDFLRVADLPDPFWPGENISEYRVDPASQTNAVEEIFRQYLEMGKGLRAEWNLGASVEPEPQPIDWLGLNRLAAIAGQTSSGSIGD